MTRIKVCAREISPGIRVWGVDYEETFAAIGTYAEAWSWAEHLVELQERAKRDRAALIRGTGDWILSKDTRRGRMYRRAQQFRSRPWTNDPNQAYGFERPSEAIEWAGRLVNALMPGSYHVIHRIKEAGR